MYIIKKLLFLLLLLALKGFSQTPAILDSFDNNRHNWWEGELSGGSQRIRDGKLHVDFPEKGWLIGIKPFIVFERDFNAKASFKQISGVNDNGVGLMWGYNRNKADENYFIVSANGYYYIYANAVDKATQKKGVREWVKSDLIKPMGEVNVLAVEQKSGNLSFYINNEKVFSTSMFSWPGTEIGIASFVKMNVEVDDFSFHQEGLTINLPPNLSKGLVKENMGPNLNTAADDLTPKVTADGKTLYFGREYYEGNIGGTADGEDYYVSTFNGTEWTKAENLGSPINSETVNNIMAVSTDNNYVLFADATDFWIRKRSESGWAEPEKIGITFTNTGKYFESCLSADGKAILFTAKNSSNLYNRDPDERDIYVSTQDRNGVWSTPLNLGPDVNTDADEVSPYLAADGRTLYFASTGRPGYGGSDIFMTKRTGDGWTKWSQPLNLGPEINTSSFDAYYVLSAAGDYAYMVSDLNGFGKADLVRIKLSKEIKPDPVVLVRGKTLNAKTKTPISADILIDNLSNRQEVGEAISNPKTGEYSIVLPFGVNHGFHAAAPGYLSVNENLELAQVTQYTEMEKDLLLVPIRVGETIQLNNVFFEQAKPILKSESYPELDRLVAIMKDYPTLEIELGGHTDNIGRPVSLIALSLDRVGTVKKYMMEKGIAGRRITGKGYGPNVPLVKNDTEEHRRMNRRVEFKIIKK